MAEKRQIDQLDDSVVSQDNLKLEIVKQSMSTNANQNNDSLTTPNTDMENLVLDFKWSTRNQLFNQLDKHNNCYYLKSIDEKKRQAMIEENYALTKILLNLPGESYSRSSSQNPNKRMKLTNANDEVLLLLPWATRQLIQDILTKNHHALVFFEQLTRNQKLNLVKQNYDLNQKLNSLQVKPNNTENDDHADNHLDNTIANGINNSIVANCSMNADPTILMETFQKTIQKQLDEMRGQMNFSAPSETVFEISIAIDDLLEEGTFLSEIFKFKGGEWQVKAMVKTINTLDEEIDYLAAYLILNTNGIKYIVEADIVLVNSEDPRKNITREVVANYSKSGSKGITDFITIEDLKQPVNGFIDDGIFKLDVNLKVLNTSTV